MKLGLIVVVSPGSGNSNCRRPGGLIVAHHTIGDVVIGTIDGLVDGAVAGILFAWLYNFFARHGEA